MISLYRKACLLSVTISCNLQGLDLLARQLLHKKFLICALATWQTSPLAQSGWRKPFCIGAKALDILPYISRHTLAGPPRKQRPELAGFRMGMSKADKIQWAWDNKRTYFDFGTTSIYRLPAPKELSPAAVPASVLAGPIEAGKFEIIEYRLGLVTEHAGRKCREIIGSFGEAHRVVSYWPLP